MSPDEAINYLLKEGLLAPRDLVRGDVFVTDASARNTALRVRCTTMPGLFLKQGLADQGTSTVAVEAALYQAVEGQELLRGLRPFVPAIRRYDEERELLVITLVDAPTARAAAHGTTRDPSATGFAAHAIPLGAALAACHSIARDAAGTPDAFPLNSPWAFRLLFPTPADYRELSALQLELAKLLQQKGGDLPARIPSIRQHWTFECLTHGDVRWENILAVEPTGGHGDASVRLIDWEHVGWGDPAWDLACAWHGWIAHGIETLALAETDVPEAVSRRFAEALPPLQEQMRAFWDGYVAALPLSPAAQRARRDRALSYLPLRLLQTAWEWASSRPTMTPFILLTMQLAVNLLRRPARDIGTLVGGSSWPFA